MFIFLELASHQDVAVILSIKEHTCTKHNQYQFKDTQC